MRIQETILHHVVDHHLRQCRRMQVGRLFDLHQFGPQRRWRNHITETQTGCQHFRKRAHINRTLRCQRADRGRRFAIVRQGTVRVIFKNHQVKFAGALGEPVAALFGKQAPGRILEVRQAIKKLRAAHRIIQCLGQQAVFIRRNRHIIRRKHRKSLQSTQIGRRFNQDLIARINQGLGQQIQPLLRPRDH